MGDPNGSCIQRGEWGVGNTNGLCLQREGRAAWGEEGGEGAALGGGGIPNLFTLTRGGYRWEMCRGVRIN